MRWPSSLLHSTISEKTEIDDTFDDSNDYNQKVEEIFLGVKSKDGLSKEEKQLYDQTIDKLLERCPPESPPIIFKFDDNEVS